MIIEQIEPLSINNDKQIDPSYAMDYINDIMNLLYTLEKKYPIKSSSFLITNTNGNGIRPHETKYVHSDIT
ncbi:unnamed protein product, partial [Rotaria sp. Silwood2]